MSKTDKIVAVGMSNRMIVGVVIGTLVFVAMICMLPFYLQNRTNSLYEIAHKLQDETTYLKHDVLVLELRINQLSSLEKLSAFADSTELGLYSVPQKVIPVGGVK